MRWIATVESVEAGEPSVLAIVETLVAVGVSVGAGLYFGTITHIVIGSCIAPLLLLRTSHSMSLGDRLGRGYMSWMEAQLPSRAPEEEPLSVVFTLYLAVLVAISGMAFPIIRFYATLVGLAHARTVAVAAFAGNWRSVALCTDSRVSPEVLPTKNRYWEIYEPLHSLTDAESVRANVVMAPFLLILCVPALAYRWSLKATAIVWFPVLWAIDAVAPSDKPLAVRLGLLKDSDVFRLVLAVSFVALALFAGRLYVTQASGDFAEWWNANVAQATSMPAASAPAGVATTSTAPASGPMTRVVRATSQAATGAETKAKGFVRSMLTIYVHPDEIPIWQVAMVVNSILAIVAWLWIRSCLRHIEKEVPRPEGLVKGVLGWTLFVRRLLSTYTIACMLYLYVREASTWDLPPLGSKWFPWQ